MIKMHVSIIKLSKTKCFRKTTTPAPGQSNAKLFKNLKEKVRRLLVGNKSQTNLLQQKRASKLLELEMKERAPSTKPPVIETATKGTEVRKKMQTNCQR